MTAGTEFPIDPQLVDAVESVFARFTSTPHTPFTAVPRVWAKAMRDKKERGPRIGKDVLRERIAIRDGGPVCAYCGRVFSDLRSATLDHVIPVQIVKHWDMWNLVLACSPCNNAKANRIPDLVMPLVAAVVYQLAKGNSPYRLMKIAEKRAHKAEADRKRQMAREGEQLAIDLFDGTQEAEDHR